MAYGDDLSNVKLLLFNTQIDISLTPIHMHFLPTFLPFHLLNSKGFKIVILKYNGYT